MKALGQKVQFWLLHILWLVLVVLLAWLTHHYGKVWDWSDNLSNSLSETSQNLLKRLEFPLVITSFVVENPPLRANILSVIKRYQRYHSDIVFSFINPDERPDLIRKLGVTLQGELRLEYAGKSELVKELSEEKMSNAIQRLIQKNNRWIVATRGHGERDLLNPTNSALSHFNQELKNKGYHTQALNLTINPEVPSNTTLLVIASPVIDFLPEEVEKIREFVFNGGNVLWLMEPESLRGLDKLADDLGVSRLAGTILDANVTKAGLKNPAMALAAQYPTNHPVTKDFNQLTVFPYAVALTVKAHQGWESDILIKTLSGTWNETGIIEGSVSYDVQIEQAGPLNIGIALTRGNQRVFVVGDGDFLSNAYLGKGGNINLGLNVIRWLNEDDNLLDIPARTHHDRLLVLDKSDTIIIGFGFLMIMPLLLFSIGIYIRRRRYKA